MMCVRRLLMLGTVTLAPSLVAERTNVILILADDLGWADIACYGNTFNETPNLDRLAREGMRFTQFYAGPVCSPTRCNLQSGQDQARFGITQHIPGHRRPFAKLLDPAVPLQMPAEVKTFAECAVEAGYRTGYFGKWHLGGVGYGPAEQGWQEAEEMKGNVQKSGGKVQRTTELLAERGEDFLRRHKDKPFLLQLSHTAVHIPLSTTPELLSKYRAKPPMPGYPSNPEYAGLLEELDAAVGRIVTAVDDAGIKERTLILFLSDNGGLEHEQSGRVVTSNKPLRSEKGTLYEGGIRIPALARWPGTVAQGGECSTPLITMDFFPTVLDLTGAAAPGTQPLDGLSLLPVLKDAAASVPRTSLFWHLPHYHHSTPASAVREGDWKLIEFFEDGRRELYHLSADPGEQQDLSQTEPERVRRLHASLTDWRSRVKARMPVPNPDHDPAKANEMAKGKRASAERE